MHHLLLDVELIISTRLSESPILNADRGPSFSKF
jgi:hypothetical protein